MCGRFQLWFLPSAEDVFEHFFGIDVPAPRYPPLLTGEMLPYRDITVFHRDTTGALVSRPMFWNLIPESAKQFKPERTWFNTRKEKLAKEYNRNLVERRRCAVPANAFLENKTRAGKPVHKQGVVAGKKVRKKVSYQFEDAEAPFMLFGAIYDVWRGDGEPRFSCSIITLPASESILEIHDRMPFILTRESAPSWLGQHGGFAEVYHHVKPFPAERLRRKRIWPPETSQIDLF